jgi:hypothetical protein
MLKLLFAGLLLINAILLGAQLGWLDAVLSGSHEPQRLKNQINPDKVQLTPLAAASAGVAPMFASTASATVTAAAATAPEPSTAAAATAATGPAATATKAAASPVATLVTAPPVPAAPAAQSSMPAGKLPAVATAAPAPTLACLEIGSLSLPEGKRMEAALAALKLPQPPIRREAREQSSHMVWIAPLPSGREGAERKVAELKRMGVNDFHVLPESSAPAYRHGVSLGVFKSEEAAKLRLSALAEKGVRSARVVEYQLPLTRVSFQLRGLDANGHAAVDRLRADFRRSEEKPCDNNAPA